MTTHQTPETAEGMTPRTDAVALCGIGTQPAYVVDLNFARKLERELASARAEVERLETVEAHWKHYNAQIESMAKHEIAELKSELSTANTARRDAEAKVEEMREAWKVLSAEMCAHVPVKYIEDTPVMTAIAKMQEAMKSTTIPGSSRVAELEREVAELQQNIWEAQPIIVETERLQKENKELHEMVKRLENGFRDIMKIRWGIDGDKNCAISIAEQALAPPKAASVEPEKASAAGEVTLSDASNRAAIEAGVALGQITEAEAVKYIGEDKDARIYKCDLCPTMRSMNEGGTVFTICDDCWDKTHSLPIPATTPEGDKKPLS